MVIRRWDSLSCAWQLAVWSLVDGPREPTAGYVKLLLPPRQSRGNSHFGLAPYAPTQSVRFSHTPVILNIYKANQGGQGYVWEATNQVAIFPFSPNCFGCQASLHLNGYRPFQLRRVHDQINPCICRWRRSVLF